MRGLAGSGGRIRVFARDSMSSCRPVCVDLGHLSPGVLKRDRVGSAAEQLNTKQVKVKFDVESHFCWRELELMLPRSRKAGGYRNAQQSNSEYERVCLARGRVSSKSEQQDETNSISVQAW